MTLTRALALFGTEEDVPAPRILRAGHLTAELEAGNLRYIRWNGEEVLRAVSFIVRDKDWGTYAPEISDMSVEEDEAGFRVTYSAVAREGEDSFAYDARIEGRPDGTLTFQGRGESPSGFLTNRTGFVILHPINGIAGEPVTIEHTGGDTVEGRFPVIIDPVQPMMDLRALTHTTPGGLTVRTLMEGDTYEMEDQRNWTDASYKTYVRPLALPWPYRIEPGETIDQTVTVTVSGQGAATTASGAVKIATGSEIGPMPPLGLGLRPEDADTALAQTDALRALGPAYLMLHHDPRAGHDRATLEAMLGIARAIGASPWLEAVIAEANDDAAGAEVAALGHLAADLGAPFGTVLLSPAPDLKCTLPGSVWPDAPDAAGLYDAARAAFPKARIGGGMFSYFTELNRKHPPDGKLDLVSFTTSPMVHAGDDRSVMETREAHGAIIASVRDIAGGTPWAVGPSAIGVRDNPYGEAAKANPENIRQAMNWNDPRQRGLFGAAWTLGYASDFAAGGASAVALGGCTGPFGAVAAPANFPQPGWEAGQLFPVFHVLRGLARLEGATLLDLGLPASGPVAGLAAREEGGTEIWLANRRPEPIEVALPNGAAGAILDAGSLEAARSDPAFLDAAEPLDGRVTLDAHAILRLRT
ncbi:hypothetical protein [Jannaschia aquimarina]|uniref:Uncharacterized protein n=1 Tax=Jannaschia aquimarina TaxID=935700 RepID=A0A0D1D6P2_9RHOB|nr:hypothetical protein [Jannaschia aquimarina]KIT15638.1 hypothetical protein jaqu_26190 [Jannaschia aquimarina]SNT03192.1 hypothetical protein SAMN05421775_104314 [Jannaschia aquimarina]